MKKSFLLTVIFFAAVYAEAQTFAYSFKNIQTYQMSVRSNYRVYINNSYSGLVSREYKSILDVKEVSDNAFSSDGTSYCLTQMMHGGKLIGYQVDNVVKTDFIVYNDGVMNVAGDGLPFMRNVPFFKKGRLASEEVYAGTGSFVTTVEIGGKSRRYVLPTTVSMQYNGEAGIFGRKCDFFKSSFSMNSVSGYEDLKSVSGKHNLRIYFDSNIGMPIYIEDNFSDTYIVRDGSGNEANVRHEGFCLYFYEPYRRLRIRLASDDIRRQFDEDPDVSEHIYLREEDDGLSIVLNDMHFRPDSAVIMPEDSKTVSALAKVLLKNKDKTVLITGHTADAGSPEEQIALSFERAKAVADALVSQGVIGKNLMIDGKGASVPVAPNDTSDNMAKNRRVEIKILGK